MFPKTDRQMGDQNQYFALFNASRVTLSKCRLKNKLSEIRQRIQTYLYAFCKCIVIIQKRQWSNIIMFMNINFCIVIITSLLKSLLLGHCSLHIRRAGHNLPRGPSAGWWVLPTPNATGTKGLTCLPKHGGSWDNKLLVTHPMTNIS
jgi:hypothetical protein